MTTYIMAHEEDEDGESRLMLDVAAPLTLHAERCEPYRLAIRSAQQVGNKEGPKSPNLWVRFTRLEAYRLSDQLDHELQRSCSESDNPIIRQIRLKVALNGGVNRETGDMILSFQGKSGLVHHLEIPYDQSGPAYTILERAASQAASWQDEKAQPVDGIQPINIQPREAESVLMGEDPESGRPLMVVRLESGHQFTFMLDRKITEGLQSGKYQRGQAFKRPVDRLGTVAEDIEWFRDNWCKLYEPPSDAEIRNGTSALRRLLIDDAIGHAWREMGFEREPKIVGPDLSALLQHENLELRHVVSLVVGGATLNGLQHVIVGASRGDNPTTGVLADADEGFAVSVNTISRDARNGVGEPTELFVLCNRELWLSQYMKMPGAVRLGTAISRADIIKYFAHNMGGVHIDGIGDGPKRGKSQGEHAHLLEDLQNKVRADVMDGLYFVVLSIGQAIGQSADLQRLAEVIHSRAQFPE